MLLQMLSTQNVQIVQSVSDWKKAIRLAAAPLVHRGSAKEAYVEAIILSVLENGPYFVIDEGLALPHARPEAGAIKPDLALLVVKDGVDLMGERVYVFAALSAVDNNSHLEALKDFAEAVWKGADAKRLAAFQTAEEIVTFIQAISEEAI